MKFTLLLLATGLLTPLPAADPKSFSTERREGVGLERGATELAAGKAVEPAKRHPLRGVITAVHAERSALMVKHEQIPGVMRAMTMLFRGTT
jgi:hypothetical protein